jgi:hypothetical protein
MRAMFDRVLYTDFGLIPLTRSSYIRCNLEPGFANKCRQWAMQAWIAGVRIKLIK